MMNMQQISKLTNGNELCGSVGDEMRDVLRHESVLLGERDGRSALAGRLAQRLQCARHLARTVLPMDIIKLFLYSHRPFVPRFSA